MDVTAHAVFFAADNQRDFGVRLNGEFFDAVGDMHALFVQRARPFEVVFFVKTGFELDQHRHLLVVVAGIHQRLHDGRIVPGAVEGGFDRQYVRVTGGGLEEFLDGHERIVGVVHQYVAAADHAENILIIGKFFGNAGQIDGILEFRLVQRHEFEQAAATKRAVDQIYITLRIDTQMTVQAVERARRN